MTEKAQRAAREASGMQAVWLQEEEARQGSARLLEALLRYAERLRRAG